ncbi:MAG TPA: uroporphyrinogen-III synthase [Nitrososphaera sp.]
MPGLKNKVLAITRNEYNAREFSQLVSQDGGRAIALPTIELVPEGPKAAKEFLEKLQKEKHDYCAFMSSKAVNIMFDSAGREAALALKSTVVIAVGPKTKQALQENGVEVRLMPDSFSSEGLVDLLLTMEPKGKRIIIPRSGVANEFATKVLADIGMQVDEIPLYTVRTCAVSFVWKEFSDLLWQKRVDAVVFTSSSSVNSFFEILGKVSTGSLQLATLTKVVSIGPFTTKELKKRKIKCFEAKEHTIRGAFELARQIV